MPRLLLVEDNEENRDGLSRHLRRKGFEVLVAVDGQQGVEAARSGAPVSAEPGGKVPDRPRSRAKELEHLPSRGVAERVEGVSVSLHLP